MPRRPRDHVPGFPHHVVQRGVDRQPCFRDDIDRERYLFLLATALRETGCVLHAYALIGNHVHLLATSPDQAALSTLMQAVGRCYVGWYNRRHRRTGTLWEGRFKARLVDSDRYVLACCRYIDLNPVRALLVRCAEDYRWSSARHHLGRRRDPVIDDHPTLLALAGEPAARFRVYARLLETTLSDDEADRVRIATRAPRGTISTPFVK